MTVKQFVQQESYLKELVLMSMEPSERKGCLRFARFMDEMPELRDEIALQFGAHDLLPEPKHVDFDGTEHYAAKNVALMLGTTTTGLKTSLALNPWRSIE